MKLTIETDAEADFILQKRAEAVNAQIAEQNARNAADNEARARLIELNAEYAASDPPLPQGPIPDEKALSTPTTAQAEFEALIQGAIAAAVSSYYSEVLGAAREAFIRGAASQRNAVRQALRLTDALPEYK